MPLAFSAPGSCAVSPAGGDSLGNGPDLLPSEGGGGRGSPQLGREKEVPGDGGGSELDGRTADVEFESKEEGCVPHAPQDGLERSEGEQTLSPGNGQGQSKVHAIDVMPLEFARPLSCSVAAENGQDGPDMLLTEEKAKKSAQLIRKEKVTDDGDGRAADGELLRNEDGGRKKRPMMSGLYPPPKRRAVSAIRTFPRGCGRVAGSWCEELLDQVTEEKGVKVEGASKAQSNVRVNPRGNRVESDKSNETVLDAADFEVQSIEEGCLPHAPPRDELDRSEGEQALSPGNGQGQSKVHAFDVMPVEFARPLSCSVAAENGQDGPDMSEEKAKKSAQLIRKEKVPDDGDGRAADSDLRRNEDGGRKKRPMMSGLYPPPKRRAVSAIRTFPHGCGRVAGSGCEELLDQATEEKGVKVEEASKAQSNVHVKPRGNRVESDKSNETVLDDAGVSREGKMRNKGSSTQRGVGHSSIDKKHDRKLKHDGKSKATSNISAKKSEGGDHVMVSKVRKNGDPEVEIGDVIVQALMAPDQCPWTQGSKSVGSVSQSKKKKDVLPLKMKLKTAEVGKDTFNGSAEGPRNENPVVTGHIGQNDELVPATESQTDVLSLKLKSSEFGMDTLNRSAKDLKNENLVGTDHIGQNGDLVPLTKSHIDVLSPKLKSAEVGKDTLNRSAKKPKTVNHAGTGHVRKNDDPGSLTKSQIVQALMAPANCPWIRGRKSVARTPKTKKKIKDLAPWK